MAESGSRVWNDRARDIKLAIVDAIYQHAKKYNTGLKVLEIGGQGRLGPYTEGLEYTCIDRTTAMVHPDTFMFKHDYILHPIPGEYDYVVIRYPNSLKDLGTVFQRVKECLKPAGVLFVVALDDILARVIRLCKKRFTLASVQKFDKVYTIMVSYNI